jgi:hypothetical protein
MEPEEHWAKWLPEDPRQPLAQGPEPEAVVVGAVQAWAQTPEEHAPFDVGQMLRRERQTPRLQGWRLPLSLAAAATFIFALSQTQFTLEVGGMKLGWGTVAAPADTGTLAAAVEENRAAAAELAQQVQALAERDTALESGLQQAVAQLLENQQVEALARYNDVQQLLQLSQGGIYPPQTY